MLKKIPQVSISVQFTHKNKLKDEVGLSRANYIIGRNIALPLSELADHFVRDMLEFYIEAGILTLEEMNAEIKMASEMIAKIVVVTVEGNEQSV